jgi:hypothetical protein
MVQTREAKHQKEVEQEKHKKNFEKRSNRQHHQEIQNFYQTILGI